MEVSTRQLNLDVREASQVGAARRAASEAARQLGMDETATAQAGIVASELANNLLHHAGGGLLSVRSVAPASGQLELLAVDHGPGMEDVARCLRDGFSTRGTPGTGLGAIRRLSRTFDLHSAPGQGTVVLARVGEASGSEPGLDWGVACFNAPHESVCGDGWQLQRRDARLRLLLVDGLGHGPSAHAAAVAAVASFDAHPGLSAADTIDRLHRDLAGTRGAAAAAVVANLDSGTFQFAGAGNISGRLLGAAPRSLASHNGTVGHQMRRAQAFDYQWEAGDLLVLHSDGIQSRWDLAAYPGLVHRHPAVIAAVLARDFARGHDDRTVLVVRRTPA
jgi:anti-sigma regulatory factor (Ser/Thr protein kinase)